MSGDNLPGAGFIWVSRYGNAKPREGGCRASVGSGFCSSQCGNKAKVDRDVLHHGKPARFGYCGVHDPVAVKEKREVREAKWRAEWAAKTAARAAKEREAALASDAVAAIRAIAAGHNDPRTLALETLGRHAGESPDGR